MKIDYSNFQEVLQAFHADATAEADNRTRAKEDTEFLDKDDGQWEPDIINTLNDRPRYTFDKCNPVVDSIAGEMEQADFGIKTRPLSNEATEDSAELMNGLIRNIEAQSSAVDKVYNPAARKMVKCGFDAWMIKQDWANNYSFDQSLFIKKIPNAVERVYLDSNSQEPDACDANHGFILHAMTKEKFAGKWPEAQAMSITNPETNQVYYYKPNFIIIGQIFYIQQKTIELVLMSNGEIYQDDDKYQKVKDELAAANVTEVRRRKRNINVVYSRYFNGKEWLEGPSKTVFEYVPIIPIYSNFDIDEDKITYRGAIRKLVDPQRVYNYAQSRAIEEGALAPREKTWMTAQQAAGYEDKLRTMNTNADPIQFYNHKENQPPPYKTGGPQINAGLAQTAQDMKENIVEASGMFSANLGDGLAGQQSGVALELLQNKGDNSTIKYFSARKIAQMHTARVLVSAIPKVYDTERVERILGEDGKAKMVTFNKKIVDEDTGEVVVLNDLSKGVYEVICDVGPAFKNRQQETNRAFMELAGIDPSMIMDGADIWLENMNAPGMSAMAARKRKQLFEAGQIPDDQMTDEEKQRAQQMIAAAEAEGQQISPMDEAIAAQAESQAADTQSRIDERLANIALKNRKQELDEAKFGQQVNNDQIAMVMEQNKAIVESLKTQSETLANIHKAMGEVTIVGPKLAGIYQGQVEVIDEQQENQPE